ncbi:NAD(P)/FAD-dependent oxidoreductase [Cerasicoccus maritimus]|uniref:NAD(P)/FAD-dependent oxidoreductase n=1 Tax=Cerasicoccus maritimus TaxID=490089 RepID=UPI0028528B72|nr:NAD(P)/FAD-dependent oxidoreductase [Cerasicoccus maritimus]
MADATIDCLIAGAGPAGTAAGILLAEAGLRVVIVEKQDFPRFRIGESLIPAVNATLKKLGVWERMDEAGFLRKYGAEFLYGDGSQVVHNVFAKGFVPGYEYTYEVERKRFDQLLLDRAVEAGCEVRQPVAVDSAEQVDQRWRVKLSNGESIDAQWFLDASGRGGVLPRRLGMKREEFDHLPRRFAVFNHFRGVQRRPGCEAGNITIVRVPDGWFWSIPLDAERTSVGLVTARNEPGKRPPEIFADCVARNAFLRGWMADAEPLDDFQVQADYSFRQPRYAGENWFLLGDSACFLDPVFSSGVYLALSSAEHAAGLICGQARERGYLTDSEQKSYEDNLNGRVSVMNKLVSIFYDPYGFSVFMSPTNRFRLFAAVNAIVAGHTQMEFGLRWRFALFCWICRLNRRAPLAPLVELS